MSSYQYKCVDESILLPFLKKNVFKVLHRFIPYGVPANYLTLVSIIVIWSCFLHFINIDKINEIDIIISFFSIIIYVIFDHFDGLQAKLTQTGSPLGEILDHYSDVFNGSIIIYILFRILEIELDWIFHLAIWVNLIAFSVTYLEQSLLKILHFGKIGSLEGVVLILLILCSFMSSHGKRFWLEYKIIDIHIYFFLILGLIIGVIYTVLASIRRLQHVPKSFIHFLFLGSFLYFVCTFFHVSWYLSFLVINAYSGDFILKSIKSHLVTIKSPMPDQLLYLLFAIVFMISFLKYEIQICFLIYGLFTTAKIFWEIVKIFLKFKNHWVWWNFL